MDKLSWGLGLCVFAMLAMVISLAYFAFVFHPDFINAGHVPTSRLFDPEAWLAFAKSTPGMILNALWLLPCIGAAFLFLIAEQPGSEYT